MTLPQTIEFLTLPLEVRLCIYSLLLGPIESRGYGSTPRFLSFITQDKGDSSLAISRVGVWEADFPIFKQKMRLSDDNSTALRLTCHQINHDLSESFHPSSAHYALTIVDDVSLTRLRGERLYSTISSRSWLFAGVQILRLESVVDVSARFEANNSSSCEKKEPETRLRQFPGEISEALIDHGSISDKKNEEQLGISKLVAFLKTLPRLWKFELYIRSIEVLKEWADLFGTLSALSSIVPMFSITIGRQVIVESLGQLITARGGSLSLHDHSSMPTRTRVFPWPGAWIFAKQTHTSDTMDIWIHSPGAKDELFLAHYEDDEKLLM